MQQLKQREQVKAEKDSLLVVQEVRNLAHQTEEALDHIQGQVTMVQDMNIKFEQSFPQLVDESQVFNEMTNILCRPLKTP